MSRVSYPGFRNGFPFHVKKFAQDGAAITAWDGTTFYNTISSRSATAAVDVFGPGTDRPLGFTMGQLVRCVWRVSEFTTTWDLRVQDGSGSDYDVSGGMGTQVIRAMDSDPERCEPRIAAGGNMISAGRGEGGGYTGWYERYRNGEYSDAGDAPQEWLINLLWNDCYRDPVSGLYYPVVEGWIRYAWLAPSASDLVVHATDYNHAVAAILELSGIGSLTLYTGGTGTGVLSTGSMVISPTKYWAYDGLYNETTGEPITP